MKYHHPIMFHIKLIVYIQQQMTSKQIIVLMNNNKVKYPIHQILSLRVVLRGEGLKMNLLINSNCTQGVKLCN